MPAYSPHASSWPPQREEDDGLEPVGKTGSRVVHRVADAPRPSESPPAEAGPSIVISPQAEVPSARPRKKRVAEPTLVIRDRQQVEALRAGIARSSRSRSRRRRSALLRAGLAGALAFSFGAAVMFLAARSPSDVDDSPFRAPVAAKGESASAAPPRTAVSPSEAAAPEKVSVSRPKSPSTQPRSAEPQPTAKSTAPTVLSLSDLPDAEVAPAAPSKSTSATSVARPAAAQTVISLEDL